MVDSGNGKTDGMTPASEPRTTVEQKVDDLAASVDKRFEAVDKRFEQVTAAIVEQREYTEFAFGQLRTDMNSGFNRLEHKLDRVLDTLTGTSSPPRRRKA